MKYLDPTENFRKIRRLWLIFSGVCFLSAGIFAQDLPKEIRGYKVYRANVSVKNQRENVENSKSVGDESEAFVKIGEPRLIDVSLSGITFEIAAEFSSAEQSGKIDFLSFRDFRINNLAVEVEEYQKPFEFKKNRQTILPEPFKIFIGAKQTLRGAWSELTNSKSEWAMTGKIFVFGHFKKAGFYFKRVVPIEINLKIKNPLRENPKVPTQTDNQ